IVASLKDKLDIRMNRFDKSLNDMKNSFVTPTAPLKAVEEVKRIENKAKTEAATWRRLATNHLCTRYCAGGGWTNGRMTRHHGTVAAAEGSVRGSVQGSKKSVRGQKNQYKDQKKKSILEADVAQCDWWIKNPMMRYEE
nr:hypothetical protein [Tanacetum cinerariifolium]